VPTPYTPVSPARPSFPWNLVKDGEPYNFDSLMKSANPAKGLFGLCMDAIAHLLGRLDALAGGIGGASVDRVVESTAIPYGGTWAQLTGSGNYTSASVATPCYLTIPLDSDALPDGCTLTDISVMIKPDNSHVSITGLTLPSIFLWSTDNSGTEVQIGSAGLDPSTTFTEYNLPHRISITSLTTVIDRSTKTYQLRIAAESGGANWKQNMTVFAPTVTRTAL
jgi:hypothetical protein